MVPVRLKEVIYRQTEYIGIYFSSDSGIDRVVSRLPGCKWSRKTNCWLLPMDRKNHEKLTKELEGKARIDQSQLKKYLVARKQRNQSEDKRDSTITEAPQQQRVTSNSSHKFAEDRQQGIPPVNLHVLRDMEQHLRLKSYSRSTIKTYLNEMSQFLRAIGAHPAAAITVPQIKRYLVYCFDKLKLSDNTLHSRINALKFYYEQVLGYDRFFWDIPRPKKHLQLPKLLNEEELARLFNALTNKKHKAMLFMAYSAGLRVSELANLKLEHIDSKRMQVFVEKAKGKKDRYVNLSPVLLDILREYIRQYKPRPLVYLFESDQTRTAYPTRTIQQIFSNARKKARINKKVGVHSLRHSFATHLLDKGTDIKYIKDLLGHFNIRTTERYLHVSKRQLVNIESPFDDLWKGGGIEW